MAYGGERENSGRKKGVRGRDKVNLAIAAQREIYEAKKEGRPLVKERMRELFFIFIACAAHFQPVLDPTKPANKNESWPDFEKWARNAMECGAKVMPFESPTLRSIEVAPAPSVDGDMSTRFTLEIFDRAAHDPGPDPADQAKLVNGKGAAPPAQQQPTREEFAAAVLGEVVEDDTA